MLPGEKKGGALFKDGYLGHKPHSRHIPLPVKKDCQLVDAPQWSRESPSSLETLGELPALGLLLCFAVPGMEPWV